MVDEELRALLVGLYIEHGDRDFRFGYIGANKLRREGYIEYVGWANHKLTPKALALIKEGSV